MQHTQLTWAEQPTYVRFFLFYLMIVICAITASSLRLIWRLYPIARRKQISPQVVLDGGVSADVFALALLANRVVCASLRDAANSRNADIDFTITKATLHFARSADCIFLYVWEKSFAAATAMRKLAFLTLLATSLVVIYGAYPTFYAEFNEHQITGYMALFAAFEKLLMISALGVSVSTFAYAAASLLELTLLRRKASWKYICAPFQL